MSLSKSLFGLGTFDFTKLPAEEARRIEAAENSGFIDENEIDWDNLNGLIQ